MFRKLQNSGEKSSDAKQEVSSLLGKDCAYAFVRRSQRPGAQLVWGGRGVRCSQNLDSEPGTSLEQASQQIGNNFLQQKCVVCDGKNQGAQYSLTEVAL